MTNVGYTQIACGTCKRTFASAETFQRHWCSVFARENAKMSGYALVYNCDECNGMFRNMLDYRKHECRKEKKMSDERLKEVKQAVQAVVDEAGGSPVKEADADAIVELLKEFEGMRGRVV